MGTSVVKRLTELDNYKNINHCLVMDNKKAYEKLHEILAELVENGQVVIKLGTTESAALVTILTGGKK